MHWLTTSAGAVILLLGSGCASQATVIPVAATCPKPPAPPAWTMQEPSNSLQLLDKTFSISEPALSPTKQP
ncbi:hypothetical protein HAQ05_27755 [Pseudomonas sp. CA3A]|uniref:Lipoprotein n=1 Tax=Pseudomonas typographi TaxID=2715964 RepID=A0ABR7ZAT0_9PSED|nr:hypothetical protein [Pseudomonas typographi]